VVGGQYQVIELLNLTLKYYKVLQLELLVQ
jgi:hypothetical protein